MPTTPRRLRTAYATAPLGLGEREPTLRWQADADGRGAAQTAFRVCVATDPEKCRPGDADVWDSGRRESARPAVAYGGPDLSARERYHWAVRIWDEDGARSDWSESASFEMGLLDAADWSASWIRRDEDEYERGHFSYFRREFDLGGEVERARAYVSAGQQYALSVNGVELDRGPSFSYPDSQYYKTVDLTDALSEGDNAVGALQTWNAGGQGRPEGEPGFVCQIEVELADGSERRIVTDDSWSVREAAWQDADIRNGEIAEPVEVIDARDVPQGWTTPGFDDGDWARPAVVGEHPVEPWTSLVAQEREVVRRRIEPQSHEVLDDGTHVYDFGRVYSAVPVVEFEDGEAGRRVDMCAGYRRDDDGHVSTDRGTQRTDMSYGLIQREGGQTFRPFNYLGIRYFEVEDPGEVPDVTLFASHNEVPDRHAATFESDDETVDDVFEMARHSALYGSQEQFIDTPTREKGQFLMDGFNISRVTTHAFGERRLSRQAIREFVESHYRYWCAEGRLNAVYPNDDGKRDIPDFTANFGEWVWRYYRATDDERILEEAYPIVKAVADYVLRNVDDETGLVMNLAGGIGGPYHQGIVDWPPEMRYGFDREWDARTPVNVLCANALLRTARIADELDRPDYERRHYRDEGAALATAINDYFLVDGRYVDGADAEDHSDNASQHANALPLAFGIAPADVADDLADSIAEQGMSMGPMMVQWLCEAFEATGRTDALVDLITDEEQDGWADILSRDQTSFFTWESWQARSEDVTKGGGHRNRSESHAMGATVLVSIQRALLGIRDLGPGGAHLDVAPPAEGIDSASGTVPTERGPVEVSWDRDGGFSLDLTVPWNATATVRLPVDGPVAEGGDELWDGEAATDLPAGVTDVRQEGDAVVAEVQAGDYRFVAR